MALVPYYFGDLTKDPSSDVLAPASKSKKLENYPWRHDFFGSRFWRSLGCAEGGVQGTT